MLIGKHVTSRPVIFGDFSLASLVIMEIFFGLRDVVWVSEGLMVFWIWNGGFRGGLGFLGAD